VVAPVVLLPVVRLVADLESGPVALHGLRRGRHRLDEGLPGERDDLLLADDDAVVALHRLRDQRREHEHRVAGLLLRHSGDDDPGCVLATPDDAPLLVEADRTVADQRAAGADHLDQRQQGSKRVLPPALQALNVELAVDPAAALVDGVDPVDHPELLRGEGPVIRAVRPLHVLLHPGDDDRPETVLRRDELPVDAALPGRTVRDRLDPRLALPLVALLAVGGGAGRRPAKLGAGMARRVADLPVLLLDPARRLAGHCRLLRLPLPDTIILSEGYRR